jgi:hypothetical protein
LNKYLYQIKINPGNAQIEKQNVLAAFEAGKNYISEGGKYILESTKVIPDKDDKAGWFKDGDFYFRVLQKGCTKPDDSV